MYLNVRKDIHIRRHSMRKAPWMEIKGNVKNSLGQVLGFVEGKDQDITFKGRTNYRDPD